MLLKSYTEGMSLQSEGPKSTTTYKTTCEYNGQKSYCTRASFSSKLVPIRKYYLMDINSLPNLAIYKRSFSLLNDNKSYESSVTLREGNGEAKHLEFHQNIELQQKLVLDRFSETVSNFPKNKSVSYCTTLTYDPEYIKKSFLVGVEIEKASEVDLKVEDEFSIHTSSVKFMLPNKYEAKKVHMNGDSNRNILANEHH